MGPFTVIRCYTYPIGQMTSLLRCMYVFHTRSMNTCWWPSCYILFKGRYVYHRDFLLSKGIKSSKPWCKMWPRSLRT